MSPTPNFSYRHGPLHVKGVDRYTIVRRREMREDLVAGETTV